MDASSLFAAIAILILFAVTSTRYGVDSRDIFDARERSHARRGII